jgi:hypothetical protein
MPWRGCADAAVQSSKQHSSSVATGMPAACSRGGAGWPSTAAPGTGLGLVWKCTQHQLQHECAAAAPAQWSNGMHCRHVAALKGRAGNKGCEVFGLWSTAAWMATETCSRVHVLPGFLNWLPSMGSLRCPSACWLHLQCTHGAPEGGEGAACTQTSH